MLYESLEIKCPEGYNPRSSDLKCFIKSSNPVEFTSSLRLVRNLEVTTKFEAFTGHGVRCWHNRYRNRESPEAKFPGPGPTVECKYVKTASDGHQTPDHENSDETDSECLCALCCPDSESSGDEEPQYYEEHFHQFCLGLSDNSLKSFR